MSVCGTGTLVYMRAFLGRHFKGSELTVVASSACAPATFIRQAFFATPSLSLKCRWCWNINQLSIAYAYLPRLRSRLTLGRMAWPRKPWVYGGVGFHHPLRYLCLHTHLLTLHFQSLSSFNVLTTLSYHSTPPRGRKIQSFGIVLDRQSFSARIHSMSQLLRTV